MGNASIDRNVLFGVLAWQLGVVDREPLMSAMFACQTDPSKELPEHLVAEGLMTTDERQWIDRAVERRMAKDAGDPARSLAAISAADDVCRRLRGIALSNAAQTIDSLENVDRHAPTLAPGRTMHENTRIDADVGPQTVEGADRFRIVRPHARGGLGEVFVALDGELNREVALKQILTRHADNKVSRTRFMMEAEVTGNLEHPGIVPVYGLGAQNDGRPYYAMRFIRGDSLEDAIVRFHQADEKGRRTAGERALELRNLLSRFVAVCNTIEYAHSRGYVHRDIKPENIMLGPYGETLVVDWGLARPIANPDPELDQHTDVFLEGTPPPIETPTSERPTQMGAVVGTPQFMSPEQAAGRLDLIGPTSDVYSLGATLYYLLTDQPAFIASDVRKVLRDVREGKFAAPRQIKRDVPPGLEAICVKAMAKEPERRYASARALADDVDHWLADEPVSALPESPIERAQRWLRRHKTWTRAAAAALVVVACVAAVAYGREAQLRARIQSALDDEALARREADAARQLADWNAALAESERRASEEHARRAEEQSVLALGTLKSVLFDIQSRLKNVPAAHAVRRNMLNTVVDGLKQVARNLDTAAETDHSLVRAYLDLGDVFLQVGSSDSSGATSEAAAMFERAVDLATKLHDAEPNNLMGRTDLAAAYQHMGDVDRQRGKLAESAEWFRKSLTMRETLAAEQPSDAAARRDLAASVQRLGLASEQLRDLPRAAAYYERFFVLSKQLAEQDPNNLEDRRNLSVSYERMGDISLLQGDEDAAEDYFTKSLEVRRKLVEAVENNALAKRDMSVTLDRLGRLALDRSEAQVAEDYFRQSLLIRQELYDGDPNNVQSVRDVLVSYALLGDTTLGLNNLEAAAKYYQRYQGIAEKLVLGDPDNAQYLRDLATAYHRQGEVMLLGGRPFDALAFERKYYDLTKQMSAADPSNVALADDMLRGCATVGDLSAQLGDFAGAAGYFAEYLAEARRRHEALKSGANDATILTDALLRSGDLKLRLLDLTGAKKDLDEALQLAQQAEKKAPGPQSFLALAGAESLLVQYDLENRDASHARDLAKQALVRLKQVAESDDAYFSAAAASILEQQREVPARCETAVKATADVEFAVKQSPPLVTDLVDFAVAAQFRDGEFETAEKTLERLAELAPKTGGRLFAVARRYAAAATDMNPQEIDAAAKARREKYLERALTLLREADKEGAFDDLLLAARLEFASELAALREQPEFGKLLDQVRRRRQPEPPKTT